MGISRREVPYSGALAATGLVVSPPACARAASKSTPTAGSESWPNIHRDSYGLIVQSDGDGGDTAQREGFVWFAIFIRRMKLGLGDPNYLNLKLTFEETVALLEVNQSGQFRRHPDPSQWWSDSTKFSRDQQTPIVAALGVWGLRSPLERLWRETENRGRQCQNGDAVGPDHCNLFQRARGQELEIDPLGELQLLGMAGSLLARGSDDVSDDLNHIVALSASTLVNPTKTSRRAISAYLESRPHTCGSYLERYRRVFGSEAPDREAQKRAIQDWILQGVSPDAHCSPALGALRWYFRPETGGNPAIAELYRPVVDEYLPRQGEVQ